MQLKNSQEQTASEIQASEAEFFLKDETINVNLDNRVIKVFGRKKDTIDVVNRIYCSITSPQSKNIICINSNKGSGITLFGHLLENILKEYLDADDIYYISYNHNNHSQNITSQNKINQFNQKMKTFQQEIDMGKKLKTKSVVIIDNFSNSLIPIQNSNNTYGSIYDQIFSESFNTTFILLCNTEKIDKVKKHILHQNFSYYKLNTLSEQTILDILKNRLENQKNIFGKYTNLLPEKLLDLSYYIETPNIKTYLEILNFSKINFNKYDYNNLTDRILSDKLSSLDNFYNAISIFSKFNYEEIKKADSFEFSRKNILENFDKKIILSNRNKTFLSNVIARKFLKVTNKNSPLATIMNVGPTGVGKTEAAKVVAELCYGSKDRIIIIDMAEMSSSHHVNKLTGSSPSYVGYGEDTKIIKGLKDKYPAVLLFDEIEKAHPDVIDSLLSVLDEGRFTDGQGNEYDLSKCIIFATSNALTDIEFTKKKSNFIGFDDNDEESSIDENKIISHFKEKIISNGFKREFINRFDGFLIFEKLTNEQFSKISHIKLSKINEDYFGHINVKYDIDSLNEFIMENYNKDEGGRSINRIIKNTIVPSMIDFLIDSKDTFTKDDINLDYL